MSGSRDKRFDKKNSDSNDNVATEHEAVDDAADATNANPPRTTTGGWFTVPKFGSAGSGGGELEPGPERD